MEYALIKNAVVENVIVADAAHAETIAPDWDAVVLLPEGVGIGWIWDGKKFIAPYAPDDSGEQQAARRITVLAFRRRFTMAEKAAIEFAAVDRADATIEQRQQSAALRASLADQAAATFIDLDDADVISGITALEVFGIIDSQRVSEILTTSVSEGEI